MEQIFHKIIPGGNQIYVWKIISNLNALLKNPLISSTEREELTYIKSDKRKVEFLACRIALKRLFNNQLELKHYSSGQPYIKEEKHISISHSNKYIAIAFGKENIGIDIEQPQEKMITLAHRILSEKENIEFEKNPTAESACKLWGTKESVLKYIGDKNINYRDNIIITENSVEYLNLKFEVSFESIDGMILSYAQLKND